MVQIFGWSLRAGANCFLMTANALRLKILSGSLIWLSVTTGKEKRCQPSPGATLRNKVVSNRGQNQLGLALSRPPLGPPCSKRILDIDSGESVMWPSIGRCLCISELSKTLFSHSSGVPMKELGKLLDLFVLRRLKGLFGWERDKGGGDCFPPLFGD